ncbi:MAG: thiolase family protein [Elusimicrobia bacterium]|nr:thiolase family protein [Elusimicrobiota bacterium]
MDDILFIGGARTPFATWSSGTTGRGDKGGSLMALDPFDLGAAALKGALAGSGLRPEDIERVVLGNSYHVGPHACYGARYVGHRAGLPDEVPGVTVGLACGSGLYAVIVAAQDIALGVAGVVAAAGADSPSQVRRAVIVPSFTDVSAGESIAASVEALARERGIDRAAQDRWALLSHRRARAAQAGGLLAGEIVAVAGASQDDAVLPDPRPEHFAGSKLLREGGTVTLANTHAIVDGGAALLLACGRAAGKLPAARPRGRFLAGAVASTQPRKMALACALAVRRAVDDAGLGLSDIDLFEINETFAAQVLIDIRELGLPEDKVNVNGGAIALGHAFGGTGGRMTLALLDELGRRGDRRGVAAISLGGGQGVAIVVERI